MRHHGPAFDCHLAHLDLSAVQSGDAVMGTLPMHLAAQVCERGAVYWHLSLTMPEASRGCELTAQELLALGATLERFHIYKHLGNVP